MHWGRLIQRCGQLDRYPQPLSLRSGGMIVSLHNQAKVIQDRGDIDGAMALYQEAERLCRALGDKDGLSYTLGSRALILQDRGDRDSAIALHKEAQRLYHELGNRQGVVA